MASGRIMVSRHSGLWWILGLRKNYGLQAFQIGRDSWPQEGLRFLGIPDRQIFLASDSFFIFRPSPRKNFFGLKLTFRLETKSPTNFYKKLLKKGKLLLNKPINSFIQIIQSHLITLLHCFCQAVLDVVFQNDFRSVVQC